MIYSERIPEVGEYNALRVSSGKGHALADEMAYKALHGSLYVVSVYDDNNKLIGLGRVIGDGGVTFTVTDIMVDKEYQLQGIGDGIMDHVEEYLDSVTDEDSFIMLIARIPSDHLYMKHRFEYLQEGYRVGMLRNQSHKKK